MTLEIKQMTTVLFLHGFQGNPDGPKPIYLRENGYLVVAPFLPRYDFDDALSVIESVLLAQPIDVIVGSSRGGALALNCRHKDIPRVLLAPAWKLWGDVKTTGPNSILLHSKLDNIIPYSDSVELRIASGLPEDRLVEVGNGHKMSDESALLALVEAVKKMIRTKNT